MKECVLCGRRNTRIVVAGQGLGLPVCVKPERCEQIAKKPRCFLCRSRRTRLRSVTYNPTPLHGYQCVNESACAKRVARATE